MKEALRILVLCLGVVASAAATSVAQWVQTNGVSGGRTNAIAGDGSAVYCGTIQGSIFRSTDNGTTWASANTGRVNSDVLSLLVKGTNVLAGTLSGLFLSINGGASWIAVDSGLTNSSVLSLALNGTTVFAGTGGGGVFSSTDNDSTWSPVDTGLTKSWVYALASNTGTIFAGTYSSGVFRSTNSGASWSASSAGLTDTNVYALGVAGNNVYAGTWGGGVFLSTNDGTGWTAVNNGLFSVANASGAKIYVPSIAVYGTTVFAATDSGGVFMSTDNGASWTTFNSGLGSTNVWSLAVNGDYIFAGTYFGGVWRRPLSDMSTVSSNVPAKTVSPRNISVRHSAKGIVIGFSLSHSDRVALELYDLSGHVAASLINKTLGSGSYEFCWNPPTTSAGYYVADLLIGTRRYLKTAAVGCR